MRKIAFKNLRKIIIKMRSETPASVVILTHDKKEDYHTQDSAEDGVGGGTP